MKGIIHYIENLRLSALLILSFCLTLFVSCSSDDESGGEQPKPVTVHMVFVAGATNNVMRELNYPDAIATTILNENIMRDLTVAIFDNTGVVIGYYSDNVSNVALSVQTVNITTHAAPNCTVYAIANAGKDYFNDCTTKAQYDAKKTTTLTSAEALGNANETVMFGKAVSQNIVQGATIGAIEMEHVCSKVDVYVEPKQSENITVTGWQLHHVPDGAYITDDNTNAWTGNFLDFTPVTSQTITGSNPSTAQKIATYYLYQNYAGKVAGLTTEKDRNKDNAPTGASYLTIDAETVAWQSVFRVYLGGGKLTEATDDYTDFNVYRNRNYTVTVTINGSNNTDVRITHKDIMPMSFTATVEALTTDDRTITFQ